MSNQKNLLVVGYVWPEPASSAAGSRMMQLLDFFLAENYSIVFATTAVPTPFMANLKKMGIATKNIKLNDPSFDDFLMKIKPQIVLFDRFMMEEQFGWRVDKICPEALKILDTEDLHFLRDARMQAWKRQILPEEIFFDSDLTKREIAAIYRCDLSLIISEVEMDLLITDFKIDKNLLLYLPFFLEGISEEEIKNLPDFNSRSHFLSIGNFKHEPNWNAVLQLKKEIWPLIRQKLPKAELHIYGAYPTQKVLDLHHKASGFLVKGRAENAYEVMKNAKICLAPLQFGAGLKGKFIDAMQCGTPSVTTSVGAEGIAGNFPWNGFIENKTKDFAEKAVGLYQNEKQWIKAQRNGFSIINQRFSKQIFEQELIGKINELNKNLLQHRRKNFTGAMLKHHLHKSTYFMSRFIEEKNRKTAD
ncbi:glycosyltransferase [Autumnicola musiva]|uniref:Glycosyltransferase n=1 Tax=Autumnicola musiva TaxID=3075589 RepID=A0ABU3D5Y5_9FLAO|nr:glycosyltransferase [Zunongwangia sp. F117]MDT0676946.1 glycosyltransferase [Zunongwangia sp. F117]